MSAPDDPSAPVVLDTALQVVPGQVLHLADDAPEPAAVEPDVTLTVSLQRLLSAPAASPHRRGVVLQPSDDVRTLAAHLQALALVVVQFPRFVDGRGYSQARLLREELGYTGPLRASGQVLHDQLDAMRRCGFDQFELHPDALGRSQEQTTEKLAATTHPFGTFSASYQPAADGVVGLLFEPPRGATRP